MQEAAQEQIDHVLSTYEDKQCTLEQCQSAFEAATIAGLTHDNESFTRIKHILTQMNAIEKLNQELCADRKNSLFLARLDEALKAAVNVGVTVCDTTYQRAKGVLSSATKLQNASQNYKEKKVTLQTLRDALVTAGEAGLKAGDELYDRANELVEQAQNQATAGLKQVLAADRKDDSFVERLRHALNIATEAGMGAGDGTYRSAKRLLECMTALANTLQDFEEKKSSPQTLRDTLAAAGEAGLNEGDELHDRVTQVLEVTQQKAIEGLKEVLRTDPHNRVFLERLQRALTTASEAGVARGHNTYQSAKNILTTTKLKNVLQAYKNEGSSSLQTLQSLRDSLDTAVQAGL